MLQNNHVRCKSEKKNSEEFQYQFKEFHRLYSAHVRKYKNCRVAVETRERFNLSVS